MTKTEKVYLENWLQYRGILDNWKAAVKNATRDIARMSFTEGLISSAFTWGEQPEGYEFWAMISQQFNSDVRSYDYDWFASLPDKEQRKMFVYKYPSQVNLRAKIPSQSKPNVSRNVRRRVINMDGMPIEEPRINIEEPPQAFEMERRFRDAIARVRENAGAADAIWGEQFHGPVDLPDVGF